MNGLIRGSAVIPIVEQVIRQYGPQTFQRLVDTFSPEYHSFYRKPERLKLGHFYPEQSHIEMWQAIRTILYPSIPTANWLPEYLEYQMEFGMNSLYKFSIGIVSLIASPKFFLSKSMNVWRQYHTTGDLELLSSGKNHLDIALKDFIAFDYPLYQEVIKHAFMAVLKLSSSQKIKGSHTLEHANRAIVFHLQWNND